MSDISTPGWEGVNAHQPPAPSYSETEQADLDKSIAKAFSTAAGKKTLNWLKTSYLEQPCWAPGYSTDFGFYREGQNTLIREIVARIERAKENG